MRGVIHPSISLGRWSSDPNTAIDENAAPAWNTSAFIRARTLIVYGDRDPLYPIEMALDMYRAIPDAALWIVPGGGHGPIFLEDAEPFARTALRFLG